jgi:hypothetical protein
MLFNSSRAKFVTTLILASSLSIASAKAAQAAPFWQRFLPQAHPQQEMPVPQEQQQEPEPVHLNDDGYPSDGTPIMLPDGRCSRRVDAEVSQSWQPTGNTCSIDVETKPSWWPF